MHAEPQGPRQRRAERERALAALAESQHGVLAKHQLVERGIGRGAIAHRVKLGQLHPVHRGVYAVGRRRLTRYGRWMAAVLACGEGSVLSHRSAAAHWGLIGPPRGPVEVTAPRGRSRPDIALHRGSIRPDEHASKAGIPLTSVPRTLIDLAAFLDERQLERAFEEADRLRLLDMREMDRICRRGQGRHGLAGLRRLVAEARAPTFSRSPLENRFAEFCREYLADVPPPQTNVSILDHEVDAYWPARRLAVEMDSWKFHAHRAAFERDRARDTAMQAAGYRVIRLTHRRLESDPDAVAAELRQLLGARSERAK